MSMRRSRVLRQYAIGLGCSFVGAWLTGLSGSLIPLSLGAAASIMCTVPLVRAIWRRRSLRQDRPH